MLEEELSKRVQSLPSLSPESIQKVVAGLYQGKALLGKEGLLTNLIKDLLEVSLQGEMNAHLADTSLEDGTNRRNGLTKKQVKSSLGEFDLTVPRDRNGSFDPTIIKKRQTIINEELDNKILSLYALIKTTLLQKSSLCEPTFGSKILDSGKKFLIFKRNKD